MHCLQLLTIYLKTFLLVFHQRYVLLLNDNPVKLYHMSQKTGARYIVLLHIRPHLLADIGMLRLL